MFPKKNIEEIGGFPMIDCSAIAGQLVENVNRCIVSSDSQEITSIAQNYGSETLFFGQKNIQLTHLFFKHSIVWFDKNESSIPQLINEEIMSIFL